MTSARRALFPLLKYSADRRTIGFIVTYAALVAAGFALWDVLAWWQHALLVGATCLFAFFNAVIVHNIVHSTSGSSTSSRWPTGTPSARSCAATT